VALLWAIGRDVVLLPAGRPVFGLVNHTTLDWIGDLAHALPLLSWLVSSSVVDSYGQSRGHCPGIQGPCTL